MTTYGMDDRALRMSRQGRPVDPIFQVTELLYRRCSANDIDAVQPERLFADQIAFYPDWSVNRKKYSDWDDVLYPEHLDYGVAVFSVGDIPAELVAEGNVGITYRWSVSHQPLDANYAHSEVWSFKEQEHIPNDASPNAKLPPTIKKRFRQILSERAKVIKSPSML